MTDQLIEAAARKLCELLGKNTEAIEPLLDFWCGTYVDGLTTTALKNAATLIRRRLKVDEAIAFSLMEPKMTTPSNLIKRLAEEAGLSRTKFKNRSTNDTGVWIVDGEEIDPRAIELIRSVATHCAELCKGMGDGPFARGWENEDYAAAIKREFGIEL